MKMENEKEKEKAVEEKNDDYEERPLTREDFFKVLEAVSGTEDDE